MEAIAEDRGSLGIGLRELRALGVGLWAWGVGLRVEDLGAWGLGVVAEGLGWYTLPYNYDRVSTKF